MIDAVRKAFDETDDPDEAAHAVAVEMLPPTVRAAFDAAVSRMAADGRTDLPAAITDAVAKYHDRPGGRDVDLADKERAAVESIRAAADARLSELDDERERLLGRSGWAWGVDHNELTSHPDEDGRRRTLADTVETVRETGELTRSDAYAAARGGRGRVTAWDYFSRLFALVADEHGPADIERDPAGLWSLSAEDATDDDAVAEAFPLLEDGAAEAFGRMYAALRERPLTVEELAEAATPPRGRANAETAEWLRERLDVLADLPGVEPPGDGAPLLRHVPEEADDE